MEAQQSVINIILSHSLLSNNEDNMDTPRDYYGDLGLVPGADDEDVKRAFRKLGKQTHDTMQRIQIVICSPEKPSR